MSVREQHRPTLDQDAADQLRQARRILSAAEGRDITLADTVRRAIAALLRQLGSDDERTVPRG